MRHIHRTAPLAAACAALIAVSSCTRQYADGPEDGTPVPVSVIMPTRSGTGSYTDRTYRVMLFNTADSGYVQISGTYCDPKDGNAYLTPCKVKDYASGDAAVDGSYDGDEGPQYGLYAESGAKYHVVVSSPALPMTEIPGTAAAGNRQFGVLLQRDASGDAFLCSNVVANNTISSWFMKGSGASKYTQVYTLPDTCILREHRSKISVKVACGADIPSVDISYVAIRNVVDKGYYRPCRYDYVKSGTTSDIVSDQFTTPRTIASGDAAVAAITDAYLFSQDYSKTVAEDDGTEYSVYDVPELVVTVGTDDDAYDIEVPLGYDFQPQHRYSYKVTINSTHIQICVSADAGWDEHGPASGEVNDPYPYTFTLTIPAWIQNSTDPIDVTI